MRHEPRPLRWIGSAKKDLLAMPDEVQQGFGFALYQAQIGLLHPDAKPLKGFGSAGILEIVEDWRGDAYRAVYTVRFANAVYVLHCSRRSRNAELKRQRRRWI
jgi:phage-related protein